MESTARLTQLRSRTLVIAGIAALVVQNLVLAVLNAVYAASAYPVPYFVGQTSFSAEKLEGWFAVMIDGGTLGTYWLAQFVDLGFIAATLITHALVLALIARLQAEGVWRRIALVMLAIGIAAPLFDVLENLTSFVILANPMDVSQPAAIVYSSFAVLKFVSFAIVYAWVPFGLIVAAEWAVRQRRVSVGA